MKENFFKNITTEEQALAVVSEFQILHEKISKNIKPTTKMSLLKLNATLVGTKELISLIYNPVLLPGISIPTTLKKIKRIQNREEVFQEKVSSLEVFSYLQSVFDGYFKKEILKREAQTLKIQEKVRILADISKKAYRKAVDIPKVKPQEPTYAEYLKKKEILTKISKEKVSDWKEASLKLKAFKDDLLASKTKIVELGAASFNSFPLLPKILVKDMGWRLSAISICRVFPNLIPKFQTQRPLFYNGENLLGEWSWEVKLDGERLIIKVENGKVLPLNGNGIEFTTLKNLTVFVEKRAKELNWDNFVFDGELTKNSGKDHLIDFSELSQQIRKVNYSIDFSTGDFQYNLFDFYTLSEFESHSSLHPLKKRQSKIDKFLEGLTPSIFQPFKRHWMTKEEKNETYILGICKELSDKGEEGIVLKKNSPYGEKGTFLKVKMKYRVEVVVTKVLTNERDWGHGGKEPGVCALGFEYKNGYCMVGTGISRSQALSWFETPEEIIGKTIIVEHYGELVATGKISLRSMVLKDVV